MHYVLCQHIWIVSCSYISDEIWETAVVLGRVLDYLLVLCDQKVTAKRVNRNFGDILIALLRILCTGRDAMDLIKRPLSVTGLSYLPNSTPERGSSNKNLSRSMSQQELAEMRLSKPDPDEGRRLKVWEAMQHDFLEEKMQVAALHDLEERASVPTATVFPGLSSFVQTQPGMSSPNSKRDRRKKASKQQRKAAMYWQSLVEEDFGETISEMCIQVSPPVFDSPVLQDTRPAGSRQKELHVSGLPQGSARAEVALEEVSTREEVAFDPFLGSDSDVAMSAIFQRQQHQDGLNTQDTSIVAPDEFTTAFETLDMQDSSVSWDPFRDELRESGDASPTLGPLTGLQYEYRKSLSERTGYPNDTFPYGESSLAERESTTTKEFESSPVLEDLSPEVIWDPFQTEQERTEHGVITLSISSNRSKSVIDKDKVTNEVIWDPFKDMTPGGLESSSTMSNLVYAEDLNLGDAESQVDTKEPMVSLEKTECTEDYGLKISVREQLIADCVWDEQIAQMQVSKCMVRGKVYVSTTHPTPLCGVTIDLTELGYPEENEEKNIVFRVDPACAELVQDGQKKTIMRCNLSMKGDGVEENVALYWSHSEWRPLHVPLYATAEIIHGRKDREDDFCGIILSLHSIAQAGDRTNEKSQETRRKPVLTYKDLLVRISLHDVLRNSTHKVGDVEDVFLSRCPECITSCFWTASESTLSVNLVNNFKGGRVLISLETLGLDFVDKPVSLVPEALTGGLIVSPGLENFGEDLHAPRNFSGASRPTATQIPCELRCVVYRSSEDEFVCSSALRLKGKLSKTSVPGAAADLHEHPMHKSEAETVAVIRIVPAA